jgi:hypothetical protein
MMTIEVKIRHLILHGFDRLDAYRFTDTLRKALHTQLSVDRDIDPQPMARASADVRYRSHSELATRVAGTVARRLHGTQDTTRAKPPDVRDNGNTRP